MKNKFNESLIIPGKTESSRQNSVSFAAYVVRLYRFQKNKPQRLLGIVEEVGKKKKNAFSDYDELWTILNSSKEGCEQKKKGQKFNNKLIKKREEV